MIDADHLTKRFGDVTAVEDLSFRVAEGEIFGFLGPNGAGKTTTVRLLCCLISKTGGEARIGGFNIDDPANSMKIRQMIGLIPDNVGLYEDLSAYRNLDFYARLYGCPAPERATQIERLLRLLGLWEQRDRLAGTFSKGMKQKLAIARALVHDPRVLFLDEPTANLDPESAKTVRDFILGLKQDGKTVFLNTHNLDEARRICDRIGILRTRLLTVGTPSELEASLRGRRTQLRLAQMTDAVRQSLERLSLRNLTVEGPVVTWDVTDPAAENPRVLEAVVQAGGRVEFVNEVSPSLEEVYLQVVRQDR